MEGKFKNYITSTVFIPAIYLDACFFVNKKLLFFRIHSVVRTQKIFYPLRFEGSVYNITNLLVPCCVSVLTAQ